MSVKRLALCLSGGGFRATLFHLGVVRALRDFKLLGKVGHIFSVSGGSILAAHLVLNWERYAGTNENEFREAARELIEFIRRDLRGRLVRRWAVVGWLPRYRRVPQLLRAYDKLYRRAVLEQLRATNRPRVSILSTSLISGDVCAFTPDGLRCNCTTDPKKVVIPDLPVSIAVAASSAFPPLFPPVQLDRSILGVTGPEMLAGEILSDGGVFDNLGIRTALVDEKEAIFFVSDASGAFRSETKQRYGLITARTKRTTDILMNRIALLELHSIADSRPDTVLASISRMVTQLDIPKPIGGEALPVQEDSIQRWIKSVRTDLDVFSDVEIKAIYRHGVEVGYAAAKPLMDPRDPSFLLAPAAWDPTAGTTQLQDQVRKLDNSIKKLKNINQKEGVDPTDARDPNRNDIAELREAGRTKLRLWDSRDPLCWATLLLALGVIVVASRLL